MSKIVILNKEVEKGIKIRNFMSGGKKCEDVVIWEDEIMEDLSYLNKDEIETITGRLSNVVFSFNSKVSSSCKEPNKIENLAKVDSLIVDTSKEYQSDIKMIYKPTVLEYKASGDVDDVDVFPMVRVKLHMIMSDKSEVDLVLQEGMDLYSAIFSAANKPAIVIGDFNIDGFIYEKSSNKSFDITGMILYNGSKYYKVDFLIMKNFGKKGIVVDSAVDNIAETIKEADADESVAGISLQGKTKIETPLEFNGSLEIHSINDMKPAYIGDRKTDEIDNGEDIINNTITCNKNASLSVEGCALTNNAYILTDQAKKLELTNVKFVGYTPNGTKSYLVRGNGFKDEPTLLTVSGCYFGKNNNTDEKAIYNMLECNMKLADGSKFENLYFSKDACSHNPINIYDVEEGATIDINNVHFEDVNKGIRIGVIGEPKCTINIDNVSYGVIDPDAEDNYPLICVQPYGRETTSFKNMTINITNVKGIDRDKLTYFLYSGSNDLELTDENKPKIYVNGILQK